MNVDMNMKLIFCYYLQIEKKNVGFQGHQCEQGKYI